MIQINSLKAAYEAVSRKSSANTKATTDETLDATSEATLIALHTKLKDHSFKFKPVRRVYIPKKDGAKRPLGIPNPRDKIIQKAMCNVLEDIYEGKKLFLDCSHGFRLGRSTHTALKQVTL
jgi:retron-type reverse transcriptase